MSNLELMLEICKNRKDDVKKLFSSVEVELFERCVLQATKDSDVKVSEEVADLFVRTFNERTLHSRQQRWY